MRPVWAWLRPHQPHRSYCLLGTRQPAAQTLISSTAPTSALRPRGSPASRGNTRPVPLISAREGRRPPAPAGGIQKGPPALQASWPSKLSYIRCQNFGSSDGSQCSSVGGCGTLTMWMSSAGGRAGGRPPASSTSAPRGLRYPTADSASGADAAPPQREKRLTRPHTRLHRGSEKES